MSIQTVNLSAQSVLDHLDLKLPATVTSEAGELDVVCLNYPGWEVGYIVTLNMCSNAGYSFTVQEFVMDKETGEDSEDSNNFLTYDEVLNYIRNCVAHVLENI